MKILFTIVGLSFSLILFGQCDNLTVVEKDFTITTTTPEKIKEFSLSKIWFSDYTPPASLIYLFLNADGEFLDVKSQLKLSKANNVSILFDDSTTLNIRSIIESDYKGDNMYNYHTVIFLTDEYIQLLSTKKVVSIRLYSFNTKLSERKSTKLIDYLNCMIAPVK